MDQVVGEGEPEFEGEGEGMEFSDVEVWQPLLSQVCELIVVFVRRGRFKQQQGFAERR
jgi:hypothetical protein